MALASSMTAFANQGDVVTSTELLSPDKVYIVNPATDQKRGTWRVNPNNLNTLSSTVLTGATMLDYADPYQQFAFLKSSTGHYYIYNTATDRFFAAGNNSVSLVERPMSDASYVAFETSTNTAAANLFLVALDGQYMNLNASQGVVFYGSLGSTEPGYTGDDGNSLQIIEAGDIDEAAKSKALDKINAFEIAYTPENATLAEEVNGYLGLENMVGGYTSQTLSYLKDIAGDDNVADVYEVAGHVDEINSALEQIKDAPTVTFSNDKVYTIKHYYTGSLLCAKDGDDKIYLNKIDQNTIAENSLKWQVYQDADGKYYLYNQGLGGYAKFENSNWVFVGTPNEVTIADQSANQEGAKVYSIANTDGMKNMFSSGGNNMTTYGEPGNDGSCFYFIETEGTPVELDKVDEDLVAAKFDAEQLISGYDEDYDAKLSNYVGAYSGPESIEHLKEVLQKTDVTAEEVEEAMSGVIVEAQPDKYYWIKNVMPFNDGQTKSIYANPDDGTNIAWNSFAESAAELWQFEKKDNGNYWIKNVNANKYIQLNNGFKLGDNTGANMYLDTRDVPYNFGLKTTSGVDYTMSLSKEDGLYKYVGADATNGGYISSYNMYYKDGVMCPTQWNIVEATSVNLTIGSTGYATAYFPFAVTIPEGVKAYTVSAAADGVATLSPLTGTIPANTGVILSGDAKTYPFAITTSTGSKVEGNLLDGVTMATNIPETSYILANKNGNLGFYKVDPSDTKLAANKAYLVVNGAQQSLYRLNLDGAVTGIQSVENAAENAPAYDLQGRRLPQVPTKGLYIQNGKKIMK